MTGTFKIAQNCEERHMQCGHGEETVVLRIKENLTFKKKFKQKPFTKNDFILFFKKLNKQNK